MESARSYVTSLGTDDRVDYMKLKNVLEERCGTPIYESYYLNSTNDPPTDAQNGFHTWLKIAPPNGPKMRVQLYKLKDLNCNCPKCSHKFGRKVQKGVDVGIATLALKLSIQNKYDRLILTAGDGDFEDAVNYVKSEQNKSIWLAGFTGSLSADLQSYADEVIWLDQEWDNIKRKQTIIADERQAEETIFETLA